MEDVLEIYHMPYDPSYPVICMDESCKQLVGEVREPMPCVPGKPARMDDGEEGRRAGYIGNCQDIFIEGEDSRGVVTGTDSGGNRRAQLRNRFMREGSVSEVGSKPLRDG
jgi:hypothetical protein